MQNEWKTVLLFVDCSFMLEPWIIWCHHLCVQQRHEWLHNTFGRIGACFGGCCHNWQTTHRLDFSFYFLHTLIIFLFFTKRKEENIFLFLLLFQMPSFLTVKLLNFLCPLIYPFLLVSKFFKIEKRKKTLLKAIYFLQAFQITISLIMQVSQLIKYSNWSPCNWLKTRNSNSGIVLSFDKGSFLLSST